MSKNLKFALSIRDMDRESSSAISLINFKCKPSLTPKFSIASDSDAGEPRLSQFLTAVPWKVIIESGSSLALNPDFAQILNLSQVLSSYIHRSITFGPSESVGSAPKLETFRAQIRESFSFESPTQGTKTPSRRLVDQENSSTISEIEFFDCPVPDFRFLDKNIYNRFLRESLRPENIETCLNLIIVGKKGPCLVRERALNCPLLSVVAFRYQEIGKKICYWYKLDRKWKLPSKLEN